MDAGMTGEAQGTQIVDIECQPLHLVLGSGSLDGYHMMHAAGSGYDALLQTFFAKSLGASEFRDTQFLPLAAVVYLGLILYPFLRLALNTSSETPSSLGVKALPAFE